jgi:hypothetical protein
MMEIAAPTPHSFSGPANLEGPLHLQRAQPLCHVMGNFGDENKFYASNMFHSDRGKTSNFCLSTEAISTSKLSPFHHLNISQPSNFTTACDQMYSTRSGTVG